MRGLLGEFFARQKIAAAGVVSNVIAPSQFQKMSGEGNIPLSETGSEWI